MIVCTCIISSAMCGFWRAGYRSRGLCGELAVYHCWMLDQRSVLVVGLLNNCEFKFSIDTRTCPRPNTSRPACVHRPGLGRAIPSNHAEPLFKQAAARDKALHGLVR